MSRKDLSWLSELQELATASPYLTQESYEKEGWMTMATVIEQANTNGKVIGEKKVRAVVAEFVKRGKWEFIGVHCSNDKGGQAMARRFYRPKK